MPSCNISTKFLPATCAWIVLLACTGVYFYFPCQWLFFQLDQWGYVVPLCQAVLTLYVVANFALATFMNPGIIPKAGADEAHDDDFRMPLFKNVKMNGITIRMKWCATCELYRPPRCSHCSVCNHCIEIFDHHCPWVNNCIGRRNYRFFFMFLLSLSVHMVSIFGQCVLYVLAHKETITEPGVIVTLVVMGLIGLLFVPIVGLTVFHSILVARGRTTNEQVTGKFRSGVNPFTRGCCRNCCYTLWAPSYPDLVSMTRRAKRRPYKYVTVSGLSADGAPVASDRQVKLFIDASAPSGNSGRTTNNSAVYKQMSSASETVFVAASACSPQFSSTPPTPPPPPRPLWHQTAV